MNSTGAISPELLENARGVVRRRTGLIFGPARIGAFEAGFAKAAARHPENPPETYLKRLEHDSAALDDLVAEITVGETYFFREPDQCAVIRSQILPQLCSTKSRLQSLRIWSAGCATGEEPYTLAMLLREAGAHPAHILGTDLSRSSLARARRGHYGKWSLRGVPDHTIDTWFERDGNRFKVRQALKESVDFQYLNLAEDAYPSLGSGISAMDLIVCRNVLIYFDTETIARVARRLMDSLSPGGWLVMGSSDPLLSELVACEVIVTPAGLVYRLPGAGGAVVALTPPMFEPEPHSGEEAVPRSPLKDLASARDEVRAARDEGRADPTITPESVEHAAVACFESHQYQRAAQLASNQLDRTPDALPLWIVWIRSLANLGRLGEADRACIAGLDRHRQSVELFYLHAVLLTEASHHEAAAGAARRALYLDRSFVMAHLVLSRALTRLRDLNGASLSLENAFRLLGDLRPGDIVPASDGESAGRLAEMTRVELTLLRAPAA